MAAISLDKNFARLRVTCKSVLLEESGTAGIIILEKLVGCSLVNHHRYGVQLAPEVKRLHSLSVVIIPFLLLTTLH